MTPADQSAPAAHNSNKKSCSIAIPMGKESGTRTIGAHRKSRRNCSLHCGDHRREVMGKQDAFILHRPPEQRHIIATTCFIKILGPEDIEIPVAC